jgi:hypothetical protein
MTPGWIQRYVLLLLPLLLLHQCVDAACLRLSFVLLLLLLLLLATLLLRAVPTWFPKAHVAFDWDRLQGDTVSVVLVLRGTMQVGYVYLACQL